MPLGVHASMQDTDDMDGCGRYGVVDRVTGDE
jgi:hypothetical protein